MHKSASRAPSIGRDDLIGAWSLVEWQILEPSDDRVHYPFGNDAIGLLCYTPDGMMNASIARSTREALPAGSPRNANQAAQAEAFSTYFNYAGRFEMRGSSVLHHVQLALNPAMVGTVQLREAVLEDQILQLKGVESIGAERQRTHILTWRKQAPSASVAEGANI